MEALTSPLLRTTVGMRPEASVTRIEAAALLALARDRGARTVAIGSGRTPDAHEAVHTVASAWRRAGGEVALELTWPETAASWLRQASRFAAADADVWIMLGPPTGWAQMTRRLLWSTSWKPARAILAGAVSDPSVLGLVGLYNLSGIAGVTREGSVWHLDADDRIVIDAST